MRQFHHYHKKVICLLASIYAYSESKNALINKTAVSNTELTEVEEHADKDDEAKPGVKIRDKVNDGNDDVSYSWQHREYNIAMNTERIYN